MLSAHLLDCAVKFLIITNRLVLSIAESVGAEMPHTQSSS